MGNMNILLFCTVFSATIWSTINASSQPSSGDNKTTLAKTMTAMDERLLELEKSALPDNTKESYLDDSFYAEASYYPLWYIECYKDANADKIVFSRVLDTGSGGGLPNGVTQRTSPKSVLLDLGTADYPDLFGVYRCGYTAQEGSAEIIVPYQRSILFFSDPFVVANSGENVTLRLISLRSLPIRWSHNGIRVPSWDGKEEVVIGEATVDDAGIYHARYEGHPTDRALLRLVVRRCMANLYGDRCDQVCPPCHNGGVCHDLLGVCVCGEGFVGSNCETPCPEGFHGADCSTTCEEGNYTVGGRFYCKQDPYGCSCARGYRGQFCWMHCDPGWYGAGCKQPCHCARGPESCNRFTGACSGGCSPGWKGESCQIGGKDDPSAQKQNVPTVPIS